MAHYDAAERSHPHHPVCPHRRSCKHLWPTSTSGGNRTFDFGEKWTEISKLWMV